MSIKEIIPDDNNLHRRIHDKCYDALSGKCTEGAFLLREKEDYLSANWAEKTDLKTSAIDLNSGKVFKVVGVEVKIPRNLQLSVEHMPSQNNFSHSGVLGDSLHDDVQIIIASKLAEKSKILK